MSLSDLIELTTDGYIEVYDLIKDEPIKNYDGTGYYLDYYDLLALGIEDVDVMSLDVSGYNYICANVEIGDMII